MHEQPGRSVPLRGTGEGGRAFGAAPLLPPPCPHSSLSCLLLLKSARHELPACTWLQPGFPCVLHPGRHIRRPAGYLSPLQLRGHNPKTGQGDGPLRLPASAAVRSSSPTPPGRPLRTRQAPPNPFGFRAIRLGSDGEGQRLRLLRPCRPERLHRAG